MTADSRQPTPDSRQLIAGRLPWQLLSEKGVAELLCCVILVAFTASRPLPWLPPGEVPGPRPDSPEYVAAAAALLRGEYLIERDGELRKPRYMPGFPLMLAPLIGTAGVGSAVLVPYGSTVLLASLAALLAARLGGPMAAPVAAVGVLFAGSATFLSRNVMSDLPAAAIAILELALLLFGRGFLTTGAAGALASLLVWIRPATLLLMFAGLVGISARRDRRTAAVWYSLGALPLVLLFAAWMFVDLTSQPRNPAQPRHSGYVGGDEVRGWPRAFFSRDFFLGPPAKRDGPSIGGAVKEWDQPNAVNYPLQLLGFDGFVVLPSFGLAGLVGLVYFARSKGPEAIFGRFSIAALAGMLAIHLPYGYQSGRYMIIPGALLTVAAAAIITRTARALWRKGSGVEAA